MNKLCQHVAKYSHGELKGREKNGKILGGNNMNLYYVPNFKLFHMEFLYLNIKNSFVFYNLLFIEYFL